MRHFPSPALSFSFPLFFFLWSRLLPFPLIQPGQWGCVQLPRLFSDCAEEKAPLRSVPSDRAPPPPIPSLHLSHVWMLLYSTDFSLHNVLCRIVTQSEFLPYLSQWHSLKVFLSRGRVWHTAPSCSTPLYIFQPSPLYNRSYTNSEDNI